MEISTQNVQLELYQQKYEAELKNFNLPEEQLKFTAYPIEMIQLAAEDETRNPVVIAADGIPVGFFVLQSGERVLQYTSEKDALLLIAFSIDTKHQGNGYAKKGLALLPDFVKLHFTDVKEVVLAVNEKNLAAQKLYKKCGFEDEDERKMGKIGLQQILRMRI